MIFFYSISLSSGSVFTDQDLSGRQMISGTNRTPASIIQSDLCDCSPRHLIYWSAGLVGKLEYWLLYFALSGQQTQHGAINKSHKRLINLVPTDLVSFCFRSLRFSLFNETKVGLMFTISWNQLFHFHWSAEKLYFFLTFKKKNTQWYYMPPASFSIWGLITVTISELTTTK